MESVSGNRDLPNDYYLTSPSRCEEVAVNPQGNACCLTTCKSPSGGWKVVWECDEGKVHVWDVSTRNEEHRTAPRKTVSKLLSALVFSDLKEPAVASIDESGNCYFWGDGAFLREKATAVVLYLNSNKEKMIAVGLKSGDIHVHSVEDNEVGVELSRHPSPITQLQIGKNFLLATSKDDISVWNQKGGEVFLRSADSSLPIAMFYKEGLKAAFSLNAANRSPMVVLWNKYGNIEVWSLQSSKGQLEGKCQTILSITGKNVICKELIAFDKCLFLMVSSDDNRSLDLVAGVMRIYARVQGKRDSFCKFENSYGFGIACLEGGRVIALLPRSQPGVQNAVPELGFKPPLEGEENEPFNQWLEPRNELASPFDPKSADRDLLNSVLQDMKAKRGRLRGVKPGSIVQSTHPMLTNQGSALPSRVVGSFGNGDQRITLISLPPRQAPPPQRSVGVVLSGGSGRGNVIPINLSKNTAGSTVEPTVPTLLPDVDK